MQLQPLGVESCFSHVSGIGRGSYPKCLGLDGWVSGFRRDIPPIQVEQQGIEPWSSEQLVFVLQQFPFKCGSLGPIDPGVQAGRSVRFHQVVFPTSQLVTAIPVSSRVSASLT